MNSGPSILLAFSLSAGLVACGEPPAPGAPAEPLADPYAWLEEIDGERALDWVRAHNRATAERLEAQPMFAVLYDEVLAILNASSRVPAVTWHGDHLYDLWKDDAHPRGLYRRTTVAELRRDEPAWEVVLDVDALAEEEGVPWVFHGMHCLPPEGRHCLVELSPGGGDAGELRELDTETLGFVEDGFFVPMAKASVSWRDADTLFLGTDFGEGSMTGSGYPRIAKLWRRGTALAQAETIYEAEPSSVWAAASRIRTDAGDIDLVADQDTFWTAERWQLVDGDLRKLDLPPSAVVEDGYRGRLLISLQEEWTRDAETFPQGSVVVADPAALRGEEGTVGEGTVEVLVAPEEGEVVEGVRATEQGILVTMLDDVRGRLYRYQPAADGGWSRREVPFPDNGALSVATVHDGTGDFLVVYESFLIPPSLYFVSAADLEPELLRRQEPTFDASRFEVAQRWATSADGTRVPYFVVMPNDMEHDGERPTHIFSYGGFRNALKPSYSGSYEKLHGTYGRLWLERGGVFVLANIRGGGEFGPAWHQAALLENRHRAFEDFEAVAEDLVARGITSPQHLGIEGRSNGGLLVTATMTRRPELYGAVVAGVPLTDMRRYHELLAGASWMAEFGDPDDPEDWAFLHTYSPYHNLEPDRDYPPIFFFTSTRDDRVHPGHARKMAARMEELGHEVLYYENIEGGHGGSVTNEQLAYRVALAYTHLWNELAGP